jgi:serine/threonine-protein kinase
MKRFIDELRRRGVLRFALAYLAGAWLVVQVLVALMPIFGLPETAVRWLVIGLAVLFVPSLAASWAFEWTREGLRRQREADRPPPRPLLTSQTIDRVIIVIFAVALALLAFERFALRPASDAKRAAPKPVSIAVLPFRTMGAESGREYFTDGVHEELIAELSKVDEFSVRSRTSVIQYANHPLPVGDIARQLGVDAVVEGSVRHAGDRVLISAQLIDSRTDELLWSGSFEEALSVRTLFDLQRQVAYRISAALAARLAEVSPQASGDVPTQKLAAYDRFLLGKYHYRKGRRGDLLTSLKHFEAAVTLDPTFAEAWDWLAFVHSHSATEFGWTVPADAYPKARAAALRALELDPRLTESKALLGYLRGVYEWDWPGSIADLQRAVSESPDTSGTVWSYAFVLSVAGRHDEAVELVRRFAAANPNEARNQAEVAWRLLDAGRFEEVLEQVDKATALGGESGSLHTLAGTALLGLGRIAPAVERLERAAEFRGRSQEVLGLLGFAYARGGRLELANAILAELDARPPDEVVSSFARAQVYAGLGATDAAFAALEQAVDERRREALTLQWSPLFAELRGDPRYTALLERMRLPVPRTPASGSPATGADSASPTSS